MTDSLQLLTQYGLSSAFLSVLAARSNHALGRHNGQRSDRPTMRLWLMFTSPSRLAVEGEIRRLIKAIHMLQAHQVSACLIVHRADFQLVGTQRVLFLEGYRTIPSSA